MSDADLPVPAGPEARLPGPRLRDLWSLQGPLSQRAFVTWGAVLAALKYNLDRLVAGAGFGVLWTPLNYLFPRGAGPGPVGTDEFTFLATMLAISLPFLWAGLSMTLRRLRTLGLPPWLVGLFVVPAVNLLFFGVLAFLPDPPKGEYLEARGPAPRPEEEAPAALPEGADAPLPAPPPAKKEAVLDSASLEGREAFLERVMPESLVGSAALACGMVIPVAIGAVLLSVQVFASYGFAIFLGVPFWLGLSSVLLHGYREPRDLKTSLAVATTANVLAGGALLALAVEGVVCLAMAAPLGLALGWMGGGMGYLIQRRELAPARHQALLPALLVLLPVIQGMESLAPPAVPVFRVATSLEVAAPPEAVWPHIVDFPPLEPPQDWIFSLGISYPTHAVLEGRGVGAVRRCVFSTGEFVEPITRWEPPHLLAFSVDETPHPMVEWSPFPGIHPPHLEDFMVSVAGRFDLQPLPGGRTRVVGTTWYRHTMWPASYWRWWADAVLHRIHGRVLRHIRRRAEAGMRAEAKAR